MKKFLIIFSSTIVLLIIVYFMGPRANYNSIDTSPITVSHSIEQAEDWIDQQNAVPGIKPGNQAEIVWADGREKTAYTFIYLHGFSASQEEGNPLHRELASYYNANLVLTRLPDHGLVDKDAFKNTDPSIWMAYAKEAVAVGKSIGDEVILIGTSTGGTIAIALAAQDPQIKSLILFSPNIDLYDQNSTWLSGPWGRQIGAAVMGSDYRSWDAPNVIKKYWNTTYHMDGLVALRYFLDHTMTEETFASLNCPLFVGYYYKDEQTQDKVVSVAAIKSFLEQIRTPADQIREVAFPNAGNHVFINKHRTSNWRDPLEKTITFLQDVVGMDRVVIKNE